MRHAYALVVCAASATFAVAACGGSGGTGVAGGLGGAHGGSGSATGGSSGTHHSGTGTAGSASSGFNFDAGNEGGTCIGATTCMAQGATCGDIGDGCGGTLHCGDCANGDTCGGGGKPSQCGKPVCTPKTCTELMIGCGMAGDGCAGTLDCGSCTAPGDTCGGGGMPSQCGHGSICKPKTCVDLGANCGMNGDGCGGTLNCGTCTGNQTCGGGGMASVCGSPICMPKTCAQLAATCGPVADGCGNLLMCGTCNAPNTCGGGGMPNACGNMIVCTNLCLKQVTCANPAVTTTVSGTVYAPNGTDPLPNVLVYVPNSAVKPFTPGVSCDNCGAAASGSPLVSAITAVDGTFTLKNMPVTTNVPLVIQNGRWRRQVTIPNVASCTNTALPAALTRFPRTKAEGDIPLMGFVTGSVDALECVLRKVGIADSEFGDPGSTARVRFYTGNGFAGVTSPSGNAPAEDQLWGSQAEINQYDMVYFACQGGPFDDGPQAQSRVINYANAGGRIFATHYNYTWFYNDAPFSSTANWNVDQPAFFSSDPQTGFIDTTFPKGLLLAQWLKLLYPATTLGQIQLQTLRHDFDGVIAPSQLWIHLQDPQLGTVPMHYTFNTPVGAPAAQQCGRVLYDDFHVEDAVTDPSINFPQECTTSPMTPQEKMLEFMIFDLGSCVTPDVPTCTPKTCAQLMVSCGPAGDGCGNVIQCGSCATGTTCGGAGIPSQCGTPMCAAKTCLQENIHCGPAGDGCGNLLNCGACPAGQTCGGGGMPGVCGNQVCTARTCAQQMIQCGPAGDGCGALIQCGTCPAGQTCGGGGTAGVCGAPMCTPKTCTQLGANCGPVGDGCGHIIMCGACQSPQTCGGGGTPSVCGGGGPH